MRAVQDRHSEISPQKFGTDGMEKICLNVGGQKHETYLSTVGHLPDTRLYWIIESVVKSPDYDPETTEIFFDRHPVVFAQILNYYRTGKLHCPTDVCGPLFEQELNYWGIDEKDMEPCCWANYTQHRDAEENLKNVLYEATSDDPVVDTLSVGQPSKVLGLWRKIQPQVWSILDESRSSNRAKIFSLTSVLFIVVSVAMFCMNTVPELKQDAKWRNFFTIGETICGVWFTLEFLFRTAFCPDKRAFVCSWTTWIDFLAVTPFYLKLIISGHWNTINALLVIRLLRLFRFFRLIYGLQVLSHTLKASSYELILLLSMLVIPVILFSSIVFFIEDYIDENTKFRSIPHSFWWSLITITTVGYGDMHPVSWPGKVVGSMCAICGVLIVALPVSIIGSNFTLFYTHAQARLKLPKKKNKVFLQQNSSVYSERYSPRRRAIRRKISRASDGYSVTNDDWRPSSSQGPRNGYPSMKSVTSKSSSAYNDEGKFYSSAASIKNTARKKTSPVSVKIPMHELGRPVFGGDMQDDQNAPTGLAPFSPPPRGYSSIDSTHYVTRKTSSKRSSYNVDSQSVNSCNSDDSEEGMFEPSLDNNKRNVRFTGPKSPSEMSLLLMDTTVMTSARDDQCASGSQLKETKVVDGPQNHLGYQQISVDEEKFLDSHANSDVDVQQETNAASQETEGTSPKLGRPSRRRKNALVSWTRRNSTLPCINEACANKTPIITTEPPDESMWHDTPNSFKVSADEVQFYHHRRKSIV